MPCVFSADETETNEKVEVEEEVTSGVTNINMDDDVEGGKKKPRRRAKKKEIKEIELVIKEKKQTDPPSVPIHELFPTSINLIYLILSYKIIKNIKYFYPTKLILTFF